MAPISGHLQIPRHRRVERRRQQEGYVRRNKEAYEAWGADIPIFSILYGDADDDQLQELAEYSHARVFDGRKDLTSAFKSVKGYN